MYSQMSNETYKKKVQYLYIRFKKFLLFPVNKIPNKSDNRFTGDSLKQLSQFLLNPNQAGFLQYLLLNWLESFKLYACLELRIDLM